MSMMGSSYGDVVIVGNGGSVLGRGTGRLIDNFEHVIRFNSFVTKGYEDDCGSRTTIWSAWYKTEPRFDVSLLDEIWITAPLRDRSKKKLALAESRLSTYTNNISVVPTPDTAARVQMQMYGSLSTSYWPSTGVLAIMHAIERFNESRIYITGIDSWRSQCNHYFESHDRSNSHHKQSVEGKYIDYLVKEKRINLLTHY